ncbi:hypothetical protein C8J55DRAFT_487309 [Lentinula edodes]|uniref:F-box domain-containing protein n=1 Tax=Lentinula lateritia TaxID=40482 RepID=A0A9W9DUS7_9AGAR|nr:hypothetical protein C8J55DRAFT_487309 [Lentinula edodes]
MTTATFYTLPIEVLENISFYYVCPRVLGPPVPLTVILLLCKAVSRKLTAARHLYARVFKYKFSFSAIQRRGFEPRTGEWAWQLHRYTQVLRDVWNRRTRPGSEAYVDDVDFDVQGTMYVLWIMCLEDDGCNRAQMQLAGVYEWVEGYIRTEMYKNVEKGWPIANAGNSCAMWVLWHLTSKARLMDESTEQRESLINLILPFLTVPFRYPSSLAPANHFRLPLRSSAPSSSSTSFSIPTPHGPYPIYLHPSRYTWVIPHFERWTPLCTPLAADAAKLVYFSRRETIPFGILNILPRNREEHRDRVRARLASQGNGEVDEDQVETVFRSELPRPTQEDFEELNAGLLGGDMFSSSSFPKGGGTLLPRTHDPWDDIRKTMTNILDARSNIGDFSDDNLADQNFGGEIDESACSSRRWDADWWRLRLCRSAWVNQGGPESEDSIVASNAYGTEDFNSDGEPDEETTSEFNDELLQDVDMEVGEETECQGQVEQADDDMQRSSTMFNGYPQQGPVYTPGSLNGLWTGRMIIPSETNLRALLLPPDQTTNQEELLLHANEPPAPAAAPPHDHPPPLANNGNNEGGPHANNAHPAPHPHQEAQEAGHRPVPFTEDTLGLAAVPLYLRLSEYVVYFGGQPIPCANDTKVDFDSDDGMHSITHTNNDTGHRGAGAAGMNLDDAFDQGIKDSWFPPNTTLSTKGDRVIATVPSFGTNNVEEYEYVAIQNDINADDIASSVSSFSTPTLSRGMGSEVEARSKRKPGTFHDQERCPGCISRERALLAARTQNMNIEVEHCADGSEELIEDLPPYVPSDKTIPPCNGVLDVLITGVTDPRHAAAWGNWAWRGRVRKWDGLVGLVASVDSGPTGSRPGNRGKYFFYGTLLGGRNFVGTWRMAHEDPRLPAYEGAFTLGRKDE